ncbi:hypothetical protein Bca101_097948 [Brassica carinata]
MWRIRIKIIRIWKQNTVPGGQSIEMVLVDSSGDKIHATVSNDLVSHYDELLYEGCSKILINFVVEHAWGSYRTTKHPYKIRFLPLTRVRYCQDLPLGIEDPAYLPKALTNLFGKTFLFKILIEKNNYLYKHKTYKVVNLITNTDMINEFYVTYYPQLSVCYIIVSIILLKDVILFQGSITGIGSSSQSKQSTKLTPAKRCGLPIRDLMREFDEMSDTKVTPILKIKKEENDFSG